MTNSDVFDGITFISSIILIWIVEPLLGFVALNVQVEAISSFLIASKDLINVVTSLLILIFTILKFRKNKKK